MVLSEASPHIVYRKIIHVDMDAFFASVEQLDHQELRQKPIIVGGMGDRGVVAAASYEARLFGIRSAMSTKKAQALCSELIVVHPNFKRYQEVSLQIRRIFYQYTDCVEPLSLDEAYLDVTDNNRPNTSATLLAQSIRNDIFEQTGLTASAGISINKFLAKMASDVNKPNGQMTIAPHQVSNFLDALPIHRFYSIGPVTAHKMKSLGIFNGKDLKTWSLESLEQQFKGQGLYYYQVVRGIHHAKVSAKRIRKSLGAERTFIKDLINVNLLEQQLAEISQEVTQRLKNGDWQGKTLTLKIKFSDFSIQSRSKTFDHYFDDYDTIYSESRELLLNDFPKKFIRLLGISISNFKSHEETPVFIPFQLMLPLIF